MLPEERRDGLGKDVHPLPAKAASPALYAFLAAVSPRDGAFQIAGDQGGVWAFTIPFKGQG